MSGNGHGQLADLAPVLGAVERPAPIVRDTHAPARRPSAATGLRDYLADCRRQCWAAGIPSGRIDWSAVATAWLVKGVGR